MIEMATGRAPTSTRPAERRGAGTSEPLPAYTALASSYDARTSFFSRCRARIVAALDVQPGDVVLDVGCGTGLCFEALRERAGREGQVVGVDASPEMLDLARTRIAAHGWDNVTVLESAVDAATIPVVADRALFCAVHDVLQDTSALRNIFAHLRPGAIVAAGGGKFAGGWYVGLNAQVAALHRPYVRSLDGFAAPWAPLADFLDDLSVTEFALGTGFAAVGRVRPGLAAARAGRARPGRPRG
jgi:SAM-dependent methyltransferase